MKLTFHKVAIIVHEGYLNDQYSTRSDADVIGGQLALHDSDHQLIARLI